MNRARMITGAHDAATKGEAELYETPPGAVRALMAAEPFFLRPQMILDPCCGPGQIVATLQAAGHDVTAADKFDYEARWKGRPDTIRTWGRDFLTVRADESCQAVVINPPYSSADAFIEQGLACAPRVFALLERGWAQGERDARNALADSGILVREHAFRERLDMHRDGFPEERRTNSARKHSWFVFIRGRTGGDGSWITRRISCIGGQWDA